MISFIFDYFTEQNFSLLVSFINIFEFQSLIYLCVERNLFEADVCVQCCHLEQLKSAMNEVFIGFELVSLKGNYSLAFLFLSFMSQCYNIFDKITSCMIFIDYDVFIRVFFQLNYHTAMILDTFSNIIATIQQIDICFADIELFSDSVDD